MGDMRNRWHHHLTPLFLRHAIAPIGAWQAICGPDLPLFVYLMRWPDWPARQNAWDGFYADPQWAEVREETNAGSELVERYDLNFLREIVPWAGARSVPYIELWLSQIDIGASVTARNFLRDDVKDAVTASGGVMLGAMEYLTGSSLPGAAVVLGWPDAATARSVDEMLQRAPLGRSNRYQLKAV